MNFQDIGTPIFKVIKDPDLEKEEDNKSSKSKSFLKSKDVFNEEDICTHCFKHITKKNQAKHIGRCSVIKGGKIDKNVKICSVEFGKGAKRKSTEYLTEFTTEDGYITQAIPNRKRERDIQYVSGMSGSGKSTFVARFANEYKKLHPKNPIFLFTGLEPEPGGSIESIKGLQRIKFDDAFMAHEFTIQDMASSLLIFDDIDVITSKIILDKLYSLLKLALETGRHSHTSVCFTSHTACNKDRTKAILTECHSITIFPSGMGDLPLKYLLQSYFGLTNKQINEIKELDTRALTLYRTLPKVMVYDTGAKIF